MCCSNMTICRTFDCLWSTLVTMEQYYLVYKCFLGLYELWKTGRYKSYPPSTLIDLIARILALVPPWTRVYRVQRWVLNSYCFTACIIDTNIPLVLLSLRVVFDARQLVFFMSLVSVMQFSYFTIPFIEMYKCRIWSFSCSDMFFWT